MAFIEVDEFNFQEVLKQEFDKNQIVILKFGSELCDACNALDFELEEVDDKHEKISVLEIDCADSQDLAEEYGVFAFNRDLNEMAKHLAILEKSCRILMLENSNTDTSFNA